MVLETLMSAVVNVLNGITRTLALTITHRIMVKMDRTINRTSPSIASWLYRNSRYGAAILLTVNTVFTRCENHDQWTKTNDSNSDGW